MKKIDFNDNLFKGFNTKEDILLDTGVILAYFNRYDAWHKTIDELFSKFIFNENDTNDLFLYVNPSVINEVTHLLNKPAEQHEKKHSIALNAVDKLKAYNDALRYLKELIDNEVFVILDGNRNSVLKQLDIFNILGSLDAVNSSIVNEYGISFLTVDIKLVNNLFSIQNKLKDIRNVYYTIPKHRVY